MKKAAEEMPPLTTVKGYHAFDMHGYFFVVHRKTEWKNGMFVQSRKLWVVSEVTCGSNVQYAGRTSREWAVNDARITIQNTQPHVLRESISQRLFDRAKILLGA